MSNTIKTPENLIKLSEKISTIQKSAIANIGNEITFLFDRWGKKENRSKVIGTLTGVSSNKSGQLTLLVDSKPFTIEHLSSSIYPVVVDYKEI